MNKVVNGIGYKATGFIERTDSFISRCLYTNLYQLVYFFQMYFNRFMENFDIVSNTPVTCSWETNTSKNQNGIRTLTKRFSLY